MFLEKNARYIDVNVLITGIINSGIWAAFGIMTNDIFVLIPNAMGALACFAEFIIVAWAHGLLPNCTCYPLVKLAQCIAESGEEKCDNVSDKCENVTEPLQSSKV